MSKVWLITGASRGLGRAFTEAVLEAGDRVVATARNPEQLVELGDRYSEKVCTVPLDVTNEAQAKAAFEAAIASCLVVILAWIGIFVVVLLSLIFCSAAAVGLVVRHLQL